MFTQEYFSFFADVLGVGNELFGDNPIEAQNMDLWNNSVGRKYGEKTTSRKELADLLKSALKNKELIIDLNDLREYKGLRHFIYDPKRSVKVILEEETGLNLYFLDKSNGKVMDRNAFVDAIRTGLYPAYTVAQVNQMSIPMSKPDNVTSNNLG